LIAHHYFLDVDASRLAHYWRKPNCFQISSQSSSQSESAISVCRGTGA